MCFQRRPPSLARKGNLIPGNGPFSFVPGQKTAVRNQWYTLPLREETIWKKIPCDEKSHHDIHQGLLTGTICTLYTMDTICIPYANRFFATDTKLALLWSAKQVEMLRFLEIQIGFLCLLKILIRGLRRAYIMYNNTSCLAMFVLHLACNSHAQSSMHEHDRISACMDTSEFQHARTRPNFSMHGHEWISTCTDTNEFIVTCTN